MLVAKKPDLATIGLTPWGLKCTVANGWLYGGLTTKPYLNTTAVGCIKRSFFYSQLFKERAIDIAKCKKTFFNTLVLAKCSDLRLFDGSEPLLATYSNYQLVPTLPTKTSVFGIWVRRVGLAAFSRNILLTRTFVPRAKCHLLRSHPHSRSDNEDNLQELTCPAGSSIGYAETPMLFQFAPTMSIKCTLGAWVSDHP